MNGDRLWHIKWILKDKLHVLCRAQASIKQVLGGDGLAQHVGDALCFALGFTGIGQLGFFRLSLLPKKNSKRLKNNSALGCKLP